MGSVSFALTTQWPATPSATAARNQLYEDSDSSDSEAEDEERKRREFSVDDAYDSEEEQWPVDPPLAKAPDRARLSALDVAASEAWRQGEVDDRARTWVRFPLLIRSKGLFRATKHSLPSICSSRNSYRVYGYDKQRRPKRCGANEQQSGTPRQQRCVGCLFGENSSVITKHRSPR